MSAELERQIATVLMGAWSEYEALYGRQPHGMFNQLHSLLALQGAGQKIIALCREGVRPEGGVNLTPEEVDRILGWHSAGDSLVNLYRAEDRQLLAKLRREPPPQDGSP